MAIFSAIKKAFDRQSTPPGSMVAPLLNRTFCRFFTVSTNRFRLIAGGTFTGLILLFVLLHTGTFFTTNVAYAPLLYVLSLVCTLTIGALTMLHISINQKAANILSVVLALALPLAVLTMTECLNGGYISRWNWDILLYNYVLYLMVYGLVYALSGSFRLSYLTVTPILFTIAMANFWVMKHRGTPFVPMDLFSIGTAAKVVSNYSFAFNFRVVLSILLFLLLMIVGYKLRTPVMPRLANLFLRLFFAATVLLSSGLYFFTDTFADMGLKPDFWNQTRGYHRSGVIMNFCLNVKYIFVGTPEGYHAEEVTDIMSETISQANFSVSTSSTGPEQPNIICIMNESLADLRVLGELSTNIEVMPFLDSLQENTIRGNLHVPVLGSGTSNTEFEFLTGATTSFFPGGSSAYMLYVKEPLPSLTSTLMDQGYSSHAFHPYYASGWNRIAVYENMGFSRFTSLGSIIPNNILLQYSESGNDTAYFHQLVDEAFPGENTLLRRYVSDERNYVEIIDLYEKRDTDKPFYLFNVTMQNHGGYNEKSADFEEEVYVTALPGDAIPSNGLPVSEAYPQTNQYLSLVHRSDEAFRNLIQYFSTVEEPTVICMFGDHQPNIESEFISRLMGVSDTYDLSLEQEQKRYTTPFYIWANYDIEEKEIERLSANYLSSYLLQITGMELPTYNQYLLALSQTLPVINNVGIIDANGTYYARGDKTPYDDILDDYEMVIYNYIHDPENRKEELYTVQN